MLAGAHIVMPSPEGPRLLTAGGDSGDVEIWDPARQQHLATLSGAHTSGAVVSASLATTSQGMLLVTSDVMGAMFIWDMETHKPKHPASLWGEPAPVRPSAISPDGIVLVFVPQDGRASVALWDIHADALLARLVDDRGEADFRAFSLVFDEGGRTLIAITDRAVILRWETRTGELLRSTQLLDASGNPCGKLHDRTHLSRDAKLVCWVPEDDIGDLNLSETGEGRLLWSQPGTRRPNGRPSAICEVAFSPTADYVAVSTTDEAMQLWRIKDGKCVARNTRADQASALNVFSDDGSMLITGAADGTISVLNLCDIPGDI